MDIDDRGPTDPLAQTLLARFDSYTEYSVSGAGIHTYGKCNFSNLPIFYDEEKKIKLDIPIYDGVEDFTINTVDSWKLAAFVKMDAAFTHDASFDIENYLIKRFAKNFSRAEDNAFINGNGNEMPIGILNASCRLQSNKGIESYWDHTQFNAGQAGTIQLNNYSTTYTIINNDISDSGNRMPVSINHVYNSYQLYRELGETSPVYSNMKLGKGWRLDLQEHIQLITDDGLLSQGYKFTYHDSDGTEHYFKETEAANEYEDVDGLGLKLIDVYFWQYQSNQSRRKYAGHQHLCCQQR